MAAATPAAAAAPPSYAATGIPEEGLYRRPLPEGLIAFSSTEGRVVFRAALASGHMEGYFRLAEVFHTQAEPAFCGLGTLAMCLNALRIDPRRIWKGVWRWFAEDMLDCCAPLEVVRRRGLAFHEFACLARCHGAEVRAFRADQPGAGEAELRRALARASRSAEGPIIVAAYSRSVLGQTGEGHYSPLGGYEPARDLALVLDVARFKYDPHWVRVPDLWRAMARPDPDTGAPRGFFELARAGACPGLHPLALPEARALAAALARDAPARLAALPAPPDLPRVLRVLFDTLAPELPRAARRLRAELLPDLRRLELYTLLRSLLPLHAPAPAPATAPAPTSAPAPAPSPDLEATAAAATLVLLSCPASVFQGLPLDLRAELHRLRALDRLPPPLQREILHLRDYFLNSFMALNACRRPHDHSHDFVPSAATPSPTLPNLSGSPSCCFNQTNVTLEAEAPQQSKS